MNEIVDSVGWLLGCWDLQATGLWMTSLCADPVNFLFLWQHNLERTFGSMHDQVVEVRDCYCWASTSDDSIESSNGKETIFGTKRRYEYDGIQRIAYFREATTTTTTTTTAAAASTVNDNNANHGTYYLSKPFISEMGEGSSHTSEVESDGDAVIILLNGGFNLDGLNDSGEGAHLSC